MKFKHLTILITFLTVTVSAQDYSWSGAENNTDFFNEGNWVNTTTGTIPPQSAIEPNQNINFSLQLTCDVIASGTIKFGAEGSLSIQDGTLTAPEIDGGTVTIGENSYVALTNNIPLTNTPSINFTSPISWLKVAAVIPTVFHSTYLGFISTNGSAANYPSNIRLDNYYSQGTIVRPNDITAAPLSIYSQSSLLGNGSFVTIDQIHSGPSIPGSLNNNIQSFLLKKGYMATMADNDDGTGKSKVFIASESDLVVNTMPNLLVNNISFIRVIPWNWVAKKGVGGNDLDGLDQTWYYLWGNSGVSTLQKEYAPMSWGLGGANDQGDIDNYVSKYKATHILGFNEADDCNAQSGQYGNLCIPSVAVGYYKNLMKTGLRLVSPSGRENAVNVWLEEFNNLCVEQDIRMDVTAVHWYDWGSSPAANPNPTPQEVFNRFKNYLTFVHNKYGLPIWITEFNANPNRSTAINLAFMKLALPYLDGLDYVERYAWFQPSSGVADYFEADGVTYTEVGTYYKNNNSTPAIPESIWLGSNNLDYLTSQEGEEYTPTCTPYSATLAINEFELEAPLKVFPNPAFNKIEVVLSEEVKSVKIFDLNGRLVKQQNTIEYIDISNLQTGIYILRVNQHVTKFIKM